MNPSWLRPHLARLVFALLGAFVSSGALAVEGVDRTFRDIAVGERVGALREDFCSFGSRINLMTDRPAGDLSRSDPRVVEVMRIRDGVSVILNPDGKVDSGEDAFVFLSLFLSDAARHECSGPDDLWPVLLTNVRGLRWAGEGDDFEPQFVAPRGLDSPQ